MKLPEPGTPVEVKVRNPQWTNRGAYLFDVAEFEIHKGVVYPEQRWQTTEPTLNITTDVPWFPWRSIPLAWIVDLKAAGKSVSVDLAEEDQVKIWTVEGSRGNTYTITQRGQRKSCTCPGFQFRRHCRHTTEKEAV